MSRDRSWPPALGRRRTPTRESLRGRAVLTDSLGLPRSLAGASASVEEEVGQKSGVVRRTVMVQGLWDRAACELITKRHGLPAACVENRASGNKAGMKQKQDKPATNVRRS